MKQYNVRLMNGEDRRIFASYFDVKDGVLTFYRQPNPLPAVGTLYVIETVCAFAPGVWGEVQ